MHHRAQFHHNISNSGGDRTLSIFVSLAPVGKLLGDLTPLMESDINEISKGTSLGEKETTWRIDCQNWSNGATCGWEQGTEKTWKETWQWQTGYSLRPPTLAQHHVGLCVWSHLRSSYIFQGSLKSVQWFQSHGVSKFALSHWLA